MKIQKIKLDRLHTNDGQIEGLPKNPRFIKDERYEKLKQSIIDDPEMLELREIIAYDSGVELVVICGNMRLKALKELGRDVAVVKVLPKETPIDKLKAYTIKDNVPYGQDDFDLIANEWDMPQLLDWGYIPPFDLIQEPEKTPIDDGYEIPDEVKTSIKCGDIIEIGRHRLLCGDATKEEDLIKLFNDKKADLYVTDPPYGVNYTGGTKDKLKIQGDDLGDEGTINLWERAFDMALKYLNCGASIYATVPAGRLQALFMRVMLDKNALRQSMVWNKGQLVMGHSDYHYQHEPILYGWKEGAAHYFINDRTKTTVFDIKKPTANESHPTMKPVALFFEFINNSSKEDQICFDSFLGSGTTMVACEQLNRVCYGMELDTKYCQVIIDRMKALVPDIVVKNNGKLFEYVAPVE